MKRKIEIASLFSFYLKNALVRWKINEDNSVFIPLPPSKNGFRERGYDQVIEVLLSGKFKILDCVKLTKKNSEMQKKLSRLERNMAVKGKFDVDRDKLVAYMRDYFDEKHDVLNVIVADDVFTTGASMREVCSLVNDNLKSFPNAHVIGITLFRNVEAL